MPYPLPAVWTVSFSLGLSVPMPRLPPVVSDILVLLLALNLRGGFDEVPMAPALASAHVETLTLPATWVRPMSPAFVWTVSGAEAVALPRLSLPSVESTVSVLLPALSLRGWPDEVPIRPAVASAHVETL